MGAGDVKISIILSGTRAGLPAAASRHHRQVSQVIHFPEQVFQTGFGSQISTSDRMTGDRMVVTTAACRRRRGDNCNNCPLMSLVSGHVRPQIQYWPYMSTLHLSGWR